MKSTLVLTVALVSLIAAKPNLENIITKSQPQMESQLKPFWQGLMSSRSTKTDVHSVNSDSGRLSSDFHHNHQHTRSGRCFFGSPGPATNTWAGGSSDNDPFDIDPRLNQEAQVPLPSPVAYQILLRSGNHMVLSPIKYLSKDVVKDTPVLSSPTQ